MDVDKELLKFCHLLPKIELHAHLNGCARVSTLRELAISKGFDQIPLSVELPNSNSSNIADSTATATIPANGKSLLPEYFKYFNLVHQLTTSLEIIRRITTEAIEDFAADNVRYLEIRTSPKSRPDHGITKESYIEAVLAGIEDYYCKSSGISDRTHNCVTSGIDVRLLLSIDRRETTEQAQNTALLALKLQKQHCQGFRIVGLDLAGDPSIGHWDHWRPAFDLAREGGLKISLHCAEIWNEEESASMIDWGPHRLGHMVCTGPGLRNQLVESRIPVEICLTSNVKTGSVENYENHHFKDLYNHHLHRKYHQHGHKNRGKNETNGIKTTDKVAARGNLLILCTDDPSKGIFDTTLSREYALAASSFGLSKEEMCWLAIGAVEATFINKKEKEKLRKRMLAAVKDVHPDIKI